MVASLPTTSAMAAPKAKTASWIVVLKDGTDPGAVAKSVGATAKLRYTNVFSGFSANLTEAQRAKLDSDRRVVSLAADRVVTRRPEPPDDVIPPGQGPQFVTNGVRRIGGMSSTTARIDGRADPMNVDVAVIDTGAPDHLDLNVYKSKNCALSGGGTQDTDGHGTLTAGLIGAKDNAFGAVGVAPGARIWAARVEGRNGQIFDASLLCAFDWVRAHSRRIDVANISIGVPHELDGPCGVVAGEVVDPLHAAICRVVEAGVTVVASAGNDAADAAGQGPAAYPEVIAVSALADADGAPGGIGGPPSCRLQEADDHLATFSNFGEVVDIAAPGVCITSTFIDNGYATFSGTSFSAPLVAGAAALLKVGHPEWTPAQVRDELLRKADSGPIPGDPDGFPEGVLNVSSF